jgi:hypothetical protein
VSLLFDIAAVVHANLSSAQLSALTDRREPKRGLAPIHFAGAYSLLLLRKIDFVQ